MQEELRQQLETAEQNFCSLFRAVSDGIFAVDLATLLILDANEPARRLVLGAEGGNLPRTFLQVCPAVGAKVTGATLQICVTDAGPGIPHQMVSRIFDPFFTTRWTGRGAGLGLSICHSILQMHNGRIWVETEQGKGASFYVELPLIECDDTEATTVRPVSPQETTAPAPRRDVAHRRILLVDDELISDLACPISTAKRCMNTSAHDSPVLPRELFSSRATQSAPPPVIFLSASAIAGSASRSTLMKSRRRLAKRLPACRRNER